MKTSVAKTVKVEGDIEIDFSISHILGKGRFIRTFVKFLTGGTINHTEPFIKDNERKSLMKTLEEREETYVKQILKAKEDYDNRRAQRTREGEHSRKL